MNQTQLFEANKRLAFKIASKMARNFQHVDVEDFKQVALEALWNAAGKYDASNGAKFSTYAYHLCEGHCKKYLAEKSEMVRRPSREYWKNPGFQQLVEISIPADDDYERTNIDEFMDRLLASETMTPLEVLLEKEREAEEINMQQKLDSLPWEWAFAIERCLMHGDTASAVSQKLGISVDTISNLIKEGLWSLADGKSSTTLSDFLKDYDLDNAKNESSRRRAPRSRQDVGSLAVIPSSNRIGTSRARGEAHNRTKLTDAQVAEVLALKGKMLQREAAAIFGVSQKTVSNIWSGASRTAPLNRHTFTPAEAL